MTKFINFLLSLFLNTLIYQMVSFNNNACDSIIQAINNQNIASLDIRLKENKGKLNQLEQSRLIAYAEKIREQAEKAAWFSSKSKKGISSSLFVLFAMIGIMLLIEPFNAIMMALFFKDYPPNHPFNDLPFFNQIFDQETKRNLSLIFTSPLFYSLISSSLISFSGMILCAYDNITGYYSEPARYVEDKIKSSLGKTKMKGG